MTTDQNNGTEPVRNSGLAKRHKAANVLASLASDIFSPLLIPTYAMVVSLWLTPMCILSVSTRAWSTLGVFFITAIIPALTIYALIRAGKVSDTSISDRRERPVPFAATVVCYISAAVYLSVLHAPRWMVCFVVGAAVVALIELLVSMRWKISAHAGAAGGLVGFVAWLAARHAFICDPFVPLSVAVLVLGILCWARLLLRRHTLAQVCAGAGLGFAVEFMVLWI